MIINLDNLVHLSGDEIILIHDSILESEPGLKGTRPDLSAKLLYAVSILILVIIYLIR